MTLLNLHKALILDILSYLPQTLRLKHLVQETSQLLREVGSDPDLFPTDCFQSRISAKLVALCNQCSVSHFLQANATAKAELWQHPLHRDLHADDVCMRSHFDCDPLPPSQLQLEFSTPLDEECSVYTFDTEATCCVDQILLDAVIRRMLGNLELPMTQSATGSGKGGGDKGGGRGGKGGGDKGGRGGKGGGRGGKGGGRGDKGGGRGDKGGGDKGSGDYLPKAINLDQQAMTMSPEECARMVLEQLTREGFLFKQCSARIIPQDVLHMAPRVCTKVMEHLQQKCIACPMDLQEVCLVCVSEEFVCWALVGHTEVQLFECMLNP